MIRALFQHPGGQADRACIVIAGQPFRGYADRQRLRFTRLQQPRFGKSDQHPPCLPQLSLRRLRVNLQHLLSGRAAGIPDPGGEAQRLSLQLSFRLLQGKGGIAEAVAEGIADLFRRPGHGFEIPVAHEDILVVRHIVLGLVEGIGTGIGGEVHCEGVGQTAGRRHVAAQDIRLGQAALDAALPGQQRALNPGRVPEPAGVHHAAGIEYHRHMREPGLHGLRQCFLLTAQIEIPVVRRS